MPQGNHMACKRKVNHKRIKLSFLFAILPPTMEFNKKSLFIFYYYVFVYI